MIKKLAGLLAVCSSIAGCASPAGDMLSNNFSALSPSPAPSVPAGIWTGSMGPYLSTIKIDIAGGGLFCSSWGTADYAEKIKVVDSTIYTQSGTRLIITKEESGALHAKSPYGFGDEFKLSADPELTEASIYCQKQI